MKKRRFANGGETELDDESGVRSGPNPNIDDDTRRRAAEYVGSASKPAVSASAFPAVARRGSDTEEAPAKRNIVTKEELEKSGLSLRDYMNKQQGLTRRSTPYTGTGGSGGGRGPTAEELASYKPPRRKLSDLMPSEESIQKGLEIGLPAGAGLSAVARLAKGLAGRGAGSATSTGRALAEKGVDEAVYLGKTAPRNITPAERLAAPTSRGSVETAGAELASTSRQALPAPTSRQALPAPTQRLGLDRTAARAAEQRKQDIADMRKARQNARNQQMRAENQAATQSAAEAKRTRKFDDDAGAEFKRGGSVQKYAKGGSVKGWGMARGARAAKIV